MLIHLRFHENFIISLVFTHSHWHSSFSATRWEWQWNLGQSIQTMIHGMMKQLKHDANAKNHDVTKSQTGELVWEDRSKKSLIQIRGGERDTFDAKLQKNIIQNSWWWWRMASRETKRCGRKLQFVKNRWNVSFFHWFIMFFGKPTRSQAFFGRKKTEDRKQNLQ